MGQAAFSTSFFTNKVEPNFDFDDTNAVDKQTMLDIAVAHYIPSTFPLSPIMNAKVVLVCKESWNIILKQVDEDTGVTGFTSFYTEFYSLLERFDSNGKFEAVLTAHSNCQNLLIAKSSILARIIGFVLAMDFDAPKQLQYSMQMLGKSHSHKQIRPWQYSVYIQTLLNTLALRLGKHATQEVMCAWVNAFAFILKAMLPPAIKSQIVATELNANACSLGGENFKQIQAVEEFRLKSPESTYAGAAQHFRSPETSFATHRFKSPEVSHSYPVASHND